MKRHNQEQNTNRDQRQPHSGQIYNNGHWVNVDDCQAPYTEQQPSRPQGRYTDEDGSETWRDGAQSEY
jgi:hypothetical protein